MQFHRDTTTETNLITGYGAEGIRVGTDVLRRSCIIAPDCVIDEWDADQVATLTPELLRPATALEPELILLGTGDALLFPSAQLMRSVIGLGIGFEVMDTAAACRTYNVLVHEGRRVVAALIL